MIRRVLLFAALSSFVLSPLRAGETISSGQTASEIEDLGEITPLEGEELKSKFRANVSVRGDYTSNAELTGSHDSSDTIFVPTIELGVNVPITSQITLDVAAKFEMALYSERDERAFVGYSLVSTLDWRPKPNAPRIYVGVEPYRYDSIDTGDLLTQAIGVSIGTDWGHAFNQGKSLVFMGYSFTDYFSDPASDNRTQNKIVLGMTHQFSPQLYGQLIYSWQYSDFLNADRHDSKHLLGLNLTYQIRRNLFTTLSGNFVTNESDAPKATFDSAGVSLGFTFQF